MKIGNIHHSMSYSCVYFPQKLYVLGVFLTSCHVLDEEVIFSVAQFTISRPPLHLTLICLYRMLSFLYFFALYKLTTILFQFVWSKYV